MTEESDEVLEALTRGRLIFPFMEEMVALQGEAKQGPLLANEKVRLGKIEATFIEFQKHDNGFNAAYESGDLDKALEHGQMGLAVAEDLAAEGL